MQRRITIQWTDEAKKRLALLPQKVRRGLLDKADSLRKCSDPKNAHKPLTGPLANHYRITYGRYRAIYKVCKEKLANDDVIVHIRVLFVVVGIRKAGDKNDIYRIAHKLLDLGLLDVMDDDSTE